MGETDTDTHDRVIKLEFVQERHGKDIDSLRASRHEFGNIIQRHVLQIDSLRGDVAEVRMTTEEIGRVVASANLPEIREFLKEQRAELETLKIADASARTGDSNLRGILFWLASVASGVCIGVAVVVLTR